MPPALDAVVVARRRHAGAELVCGVDQAKPILSSPSLFDRSVMRCLMRESAPANGSVIFAARSGAARLVSSGAEFPPGQAGFDSDRDVYVDSTSTRTFQVYDLDKVSGFQLPGLPVQRSSFNRRHFPQSLGYIAMGRVFASLIVCKMAG